jgi:hypothetical protein
MADFADLLSSKVEDAKRPPSLPVGNYILAIKGYEAVESDKKKTPGIEVTYGVVAPAEGVDPRLLEGIDLSQRELYDSFWLTDAAKYRLREFLEKIGCNIHGRSFREVLPEINGMKVKAYVTQVPSDKPGDDRIFNNITGYAKP